MPWNNPIVGSTILRRPAIQSPNFVSGSTGWALFQDGTAQLNELTIIVQNTGVAILIYNGTAAFGNLIGSWASQAGTDSFGNAFPAGLSAQGGVLNGTTINVGNLVNCILSTPTISGGTIGTTTISGGTMSETAITFDTGGGSLFIYSSTTTTTTFSTNGQQFWTAPAGVTSAKVECWGGGAGGGGGSSAGGGEAGGGGEYAQEPNYPITAGNVYTVQVGQGGPGGFTNFAGQGGGDTLFDNGGVFANGGNNGSGGVGGTGGSGSTNTIHHNGGNGGTGNLGNDGAGGGGSGGSSGAGGNGGNGGGSAGAGGAAGSGGGAAGGAGGVSNANGNAGSGPGGAGGGAGKATTSTQISKSYRPTATYSYYGSQASSNPNGKENTNGVMLQGVYSGGLSVNGDQYSFGLYNFSQIRSDFSGATIDSVKITVQNQHSWYNSGMYLVWGYGTASSYGDPFVPGAGTHENIQQNWINEGSTTQYDLTSALSAVIASTFTAIMFGPSGSTTGGPTDLYNYGYQTGGTSGPLLAIVGHTASGGGVTAGSGHDGEVKITYTSGTTLIASISAVATTDSFGNAIPVGIAGVHAGTDYAALGDDGTNAALMFGAAGSAFDTELKRTGAGLLQTSQLNLSTVLNMLQTTTPSAPANGVKFWVDTSNVIHFLNSSSIDELLLAAGAGPYKDTAWSLISQPSQTNNGLPGPCSARVKLLPWKMVALEVEFGVQAANTATTQTFGSLPSAAYYPVNARHFPLVSTGTVIGRMFVPTSGGLQALFTASGANLTFGCNVMYGID